VQSDVANNVVSDIARHDIVRLRWQILEDIEEEFCHVQLNIRMLLRIHYKVKSLVHSLAAPTMALRPRSLPPQIRLPKSVYVVN